MKKILIPYDGSDYANRAVEKAKELARTMGGDIILLNVVHSTFPIYSFGHTITPIDDINSLVDELHRKSVELLDAAKKSFGGMAGNVEVLSMDGDAAKTIIDYAGSHEVDMIIMGAHGLGVSANRPMLGSITTKVLHHVQKPVLVVK